MSTGKLNKRKRKAQFPATSFHRLLDVFFALLVFSIWSRFFLVAISEGFFRILCSHNVILQIFKPLNTNGFLGFRLESMLFVNGTRLENQFLKKQLGLKVNHPIPKFALHGLSK